MIGWHIYTDPERDSSVEYRSHVLLPAADREEAKRLAKKILRHDPDKYVCEPLTPGDEAVTVMIPEYLTLLHPGVDRTAWRSYYPG
jgi:hypothetical protein